MFECPICGCDVPEMDMWDGTTYTFYCFDCHTKTELNYNPFEEDKK